MLLCICVWVCAEECAASSRRRQIPWSGSERQLWAPPCGWWGVNLSPLGEPQVLLTIEPSLQPLLCISQMSSTIHTQKPNVAHHSLDFSYQFSWWSVVWNMFSYSSCWWLCLRRNVYENLWPTFSKLRDIFTFLCTLKVHVLMLRNCFYVTFEMCGLLFL